MNLDYRHFLPWVFVRPIMMVDSNCGAHFGDNDKQMSS
jgi:hypothetical protein